VSLIYESIDAATSPRHKQRVTLRLVPGLGFDAAVGEHEAWLRALARRLTRSPADAEDLLQDSLEKALRAWDRFQPGTNLRAWLSAIMNNLFIDRCRAGGRGAAVNLDEARELPSPPRDAEPAWAHLGEADVLAALVHVLPEFRAVYELHLEGLGYQAIADKLGVPRATVGTRLLRARRALREVLAKTLEARHG